MRTQEEWEQLEQELEPAYVNLCREHGVDPLGLHVDLQNFIDDAEKDAVLEWGDHFLTIEDVKVLISCLEVAGGF